jgi:hypothetical protein
MATYTRFSPDDVVITTEKVFTSTWTNNTNKLTTVFTASADNPSVGSNFSTPSSSGQYFINVHNTSVGTTSEIQYSISYGNKVGSGSENFHAGANADGFNSSKAIYSQYRSMVYGDETRDFTFGSTTPDDIIVINISRARYKQALRLGSLNLKFSNNVKTNLTDDSITNSGSAVITNAGRQYNIVTGSSGVAQSTTTTYGFLYPDAGFMVLNGDAIGDVTNGLNTLNFITSSNTQGANHALTLGQISEFELDTQENISSQFYFVRAKNKEFNYTTNPSFIDSRGNLNYTSMIDNPVSYITTVGLYNDANELLAVAKLSQPIIKDFTKEALIKVKLDY